MIASSLADDLLDFEDSDSLSTILAKAGGTMLGLKLYDKLHKK